MPPALRVALWFGLAGPVAYAGHLVLTFWLTPVACAQGTRWPLVASTAASAAVAAAALLVAIRTRRSLRAGDRGGEPGSLPVSPGASAAARWAARFLVIPALLTTRRQAPRTEPAGRAMRGPRPLFMATVGMYLSALSLAIILLAGYPIARLGPC